VVIFDAVGWPDVLVALIYGLPAIIAAVTALAIRREVRTKNGHTLAETVEQAEHHAAETKAVVTRTLGERHKDKPAPRPRVSGERAEDE
jgi:hypothetical protein